MSKRKKSDSATWRGIEQKGPSKGIGKVKGRISFFKTGKVMAIVLGSLMIVGAGVFGFLEIKRGVSLLTPASHPLREVIVETNGVLRESLLAKALQLPEKVDLLDIDIFELKEKIEDLGQVKSAMVERQLPDTLKITLVEHVPVLKVVHVDNHNRREGLLVARDGTVFKGFGYSKSFLQSLLYVEGVNIQKTAGKYRPLRQVGLINELISLAQNEKPHLYKKWHSVSFAYLDDALGPAGSFVKVKTKNYGDVIFSPQQYEVQLNRLDSIISYADERHLAHIERIDLSMQGQAAVQVASSFAKSKGV